MENNESPESRTEGRRHWQLDKTISVGHLLSTALIGITVFSWASTLQLRVEKNAQTILHIKEQQNRNEGRVESIRSEIKEDLRNINSKLDRLIENKG